MQQKIAARVFGNTFGQNAYFIYPKSRDGARAAAESAEETLRGT